MPTLSHVTASHTTAIQSWKPQARADAGSGLAELAEQVAQGFRHAGLPLPLIAAQTHFSLHNSLLSPSQWAVISARLGTREKPQRLLLADEADLSAYPACRQQWDCAHFGVGAQIKTDDGKRLVFLVASEQGYVNLSQLLSALHRDAFLLQRWIYRKQALPDCSGLLVLVQDMQWLEILREAGAEVYWRSSVNLQQAPTGIPLVAAPICGFSHETDLEMLPVLAALRENGRVGDAVARDDIASLEALLTMPAHYRGHEEAIERGCELLERCCYHPSPLIKLPPHVHADPDTVLLEKCAVGLRKRYEHGNLHAAKERLAFELDIVSRKQFSSYILTVYELAQRRRTCGRGSGASSIICYCLGLTNVDPIRYNLVFERFLAPEREDPPDIDLDFPWDERDAVFSAAIQRYGREHVAMVCTHLHYRKWSVLREVARVHNMKRDKITAVKRELSQLNRFGGQAVLTHKWLPIFEQAQRLFGAPRHYGLHPGGLIITHCPTAMLVPTHPSKKLIDGEPLPSIAWEKDGAEAMGLLKIDILGNRSLAVIRDTIQDLQEDGISIDEHLWRPQDDLATCALIAAGKTMGCFYIESPAMRQLNAKAGSGDFDRLVVHSSIVRPAANKWIQTYLERLHAYRRTGIICDDWFVHPVLKNLLSESFGILSYQEDVMLVAKELAGFSSRDQNYLRKSLGRTDTMERLQAVRVKFMDGCSARGVTDAVATHVWSMISSFAGYSFCKAHSASYAMVSFQCAYLKAHHPAYFMARVMSNEGGFYGRSAYVEEARRLGIQISAPCVLSSDYPTKRAHGGRSIRLGLQCIPHLHKAHALQIVAESRKRRFKTFTEFYLRCPLALRECLSLEKAGAFNALLRSYNQAQRQWIIESVHIAHAGKQKLKTVFTQSINRLFGYSDPEPPDLASPSPRSVWRQRFETIGCLPYRHPLCLWGLVKRRRCQSIENVNATREGQRLEICAWSITGKQVTAIQRKGENGEELEEPRRSLMSFVTLEDETGILETTWFPRVYQRYGHYLSETQPLYVYGHVQVEFGFVSLNVERVAPL